MGRNATLYVVVKHLKERFYWQMSMTVGDLIKNKDYDYISWRATLPERVGGGDTFIGCTESKNGKLFALDGDIYSEDTEILEYREWSKEEEGINNGLTIVFKGEWYE